MSETKCECDFCGSVCDHLYPINDGLWAICKVCMIVEYDLIPKALRLRERQQPEDPDSPRLSLAESYEKWLDSLLEDSDGISQDEIPLVGEEE